MSWYGVSLTTEVVVQLLLLIFIWLLIRNFLSPYHFLRRGRIIHWKFRRLSIQVRFGVFGSILIVFIFLLISGFDHCNDHGECANKITVLLQSKPSEFGDTLAGIAGSLAFLWIIVTVMMQSKELEAQRTELQLTRDEMVLQRNVSEASKENLEKQRVDSFLFDLISTHNSIVEAIDLRSRDGGGVVAQGRDTFKNFYSELKLSDSEAFYPMMSVDTTMQKYEAMYATHRHDLAHYFRFVHNAMRAISQASSVEKRHKRLYRSLFSDDELLVIFYNAQTELGHRMIDWIEDFQLFNNLPKERLIFREHESWYSHNCYGEPQ